MKPTPDRAIVAQLKRIDQDLSVEFVEPPSRFAVFHDLQVPGNLEQTADLIGREFQRAAALAGHIIALGECQYAASMALRDAKLVCYVTEDDGSFRPLDGRVVEKLLRMDYYRRNLGLRDWKEMLRAKADEARDRRLREQGDVWDTIRRDSTFARLASDLLWGLKPTRSVTVPGVAA